MIGCIRGIASPLRGLPLFAAAPRGLSGDKPSSAQPMRRETRGGVPAHGFRRYRGKNDARIERAGLTPQRCPKKGRPTKPYSSQGGRCDPTCGDLNRLKRERFSSCDSHFSETILERESGTGAPEWALGLTPGTGIP